jgi:hypothetical protein
MSIRTNIEAIMAEIGGGNEALGQSMRVKAVNAIKAGAGSSEWLDYMGQFSQSAEQLARLTPTDDTLNEFDFDVARTYLVGNGVCGAATTGDTLIFGVEDKLDEDLAG